MAISIDAIRALALDLGPRAAKTYADGRVGDDTISALARAGLFAGGLASGTMLDAARLLAQHCASTAWLAAAAALGGAGVAALGPHAKELPTSDSFATWADRADRATLAAEGGAFRLSGVWRAVPGAALAKVFMLRVDTARAVAVPVAELKIAVPDHQAGLRGATLGDVTAEHILVPGARVLTISPALAAMAAAAPLGVALGAAEGGFREYVASTKKRMSTVGGGAVAKLPQVHVRLAEAEAELDAARAMVAGVVRTLADGAPGETLARDAAFIARQCHRALTLLVQQMGAVGLLETNVVQRFARDLRAVVADHRLAWDPAMAARGRAVLGVTADDAGAEPVAV